MTVTKLKSVPRQLPEPTTPRPYNDDKGRKRVADLRKLLERAAVRYVREGKSRSCGERLREISYVSGIPIGVLEKL